MAFQRLSNPNTYAPSMRPNAGMFPSALQGLLDRNAPAQKIGDDSPFTTARVTMGASPLSSNAGPQPKPEARQSVWQYPDSASATTSPVTQSLMQPQESSVNVPPVIGEREPAWIDAPKPPPADEMGGRRDPYQFMDYNAPVIPINELEQLQYYLSSPVAARRMM